MAFLINIMYILVIVNIKFTIADKPCAALPIERQSVVCVCNATYCDELTRHIPEEGQYVTYTSSKNGLRFSKTNGSLTTLNSSNQDILFELNVTEKYQSMLGFGGAVTDSAALLWASLPKDQRDYLVNSYFSTKGLEYNLIRVPIGGTDFSTRGYTYQDFPENDTMLSNFTLADEDILYKIPLIKSCMEAATDSVYVYGSTWSSPLWMKDVHNYTGLTHMLPEYFESYALYHSKFIKEYEKLGVPIWGLTTTNEPMDGYSTIPYLNDVGFTAEALTEYIAYHFGPLMRKEHKDVKILAIDDQRKFLNYYFDEIKNNSVALDYIDGIAVHWYYDNETSPLILSQIAEDHPDKFILYTEASAGFDADSSSSVILGSWERARKEIIDVLENLNHYVTGWTDWNLALDTEGGPSWLGSQLDAHILVDVNNSLFYKQPMFYGLGHFSKFIPRGSVRIGVRNGTSPVSETAVLTPEDTIVVILYNDSNSTSSVTVREGQRDAILELEPNSITTLEFLSEQ